MDKKLEARIAKLERMMNRKSVKNEISRGYATMNEIDTAAGEVKKATLKLYRLLERFGDDGLMDLFYNLSSAVDEMLKATGEILHEDTGY